MRLAEIPVDPDAPEARRWLLDELAKPEYRAAEPTWFDRLAQQIRDWLGDLFSGAGGLPEPVVALIAVLVVAALVVVALLVFGLPRLRRRRSSAEALFDDGDTRTLAELRRAADAAEAAGRFDLAIEERFRAIARALVDREIVRMHPGTTAHGFAASAAGSFPDFGMRLSEASDAFDGVRYLGRAGSLVEVRALAALDADLERSTPVAVGAGAGSGSGSGSGEFARIA
ncbi:DUF4129 domain-containing protein [Agromyces protaetiae]|uniref:DUF4129 domain-containing protein n=1 Tax=Agromyces protaetiae TaxID=2509455 RepID=A0A4P6FKN3_9MICO|nr:DUF4129 domain-containing protein [Agromyces protaetiae]QAY74547.1 DUF4129 domain-containing protein [Agromyces protaetiae]